MAISLKEATISHVKTDRDYGLIPEDEASRLIVDVHSGGKAFRNVVSRYRVGTAPALAVGGQTGQAVQVDYRR